MNIELALWNVVISLPESLKRELLHYAEYLREKYPNNQQSTEQIETAHGYGSWSGQIIISDDFDEPLELPMLLAKEETFGSQVGHFS